MTYAIETALQKRTQYFNEIIADDKNLRTWWFILDRSDLIIEEKKFILDFSIRFVQQSVREKMEIDFYTIRFNRLIAKEVRHNINAVYVLKGWDTMELR